MSETLEEKIEQLYKYVHEWAVPHHSNDLLTEIQTELDTGKTIDNEYTILLTKCAKELLKRASIPVYCKCGHEYGSHVNFDRGMTPGCDGSKNHPCDCTIFTQQTK